MSEQQINTLDDWTIIEDPTEAVIPGEDDDDPNILAPTSQQDDWESIPAENNISAIPSLNTSPVNLNNSLQETTFQQQEQEQIHEPNLTTSEAEGDLSRECPACTLLNHISLSHCEACNSELHPSTKDSSNIDPPLHERLKGCHQCTFMNPWGEEWCNMCGSVLDTQYFDRPESIV